MPAQGMWLECNGQSTAAYPALTAVVGSNVPDYRGIFLRGYGSQTSYHYNTVTHSSGALGALQGDAIRNITGNFGLVHPSGINPPFFHGNYGTGGVEWGASPWAYVNFDVSSVVPTSNENRPINKAVRYLIKAQ